MDKKDMDRATNHTEERQVYMTAKDGSMVRVPESRLADWIKAQENPNLEASKPDDELLTMALEKMGYSPSQMKEAMAGEKLEEVLWMKEWYRKMEEAFRIQEKAHTKHSEGARQEKEK